MEVILRGGGERSDDAEFLGLIPDHLLNGTGVHFAQVAPTHHEGQSRERAYFDHVDSLTTWLLLIPGMRFGSFADASHRGL